MFFKRLFCAHYWSEGMPIDAQYGVGIIKIYTCTKCGKTTKTADEPISYVGDR